MKGQREWLQDLIVISSLGYVFHSWCNLGALCANFLKRDANKTAVEHKNTRYKKNTTVLQKYLLLNMCQTGGDWTLG